LIWVLILAVALAGVAALMVSKSTTVRAITVGGAALAALGYFLIGKPGMADDPLDRRVADLERRANDAAQAQPLDLAETMALLEHRARTNPNDAEPHFQMALLNDIARRQALGQLDYQAGLRRDEGYRTKLAQLEQASASEAAIAAMQPTEMLMLLENRAWQEPANPTARVMMGRIAEGTGQTQRAMMYYEAALARDPNSAQALAAQAGLIFRATGQFDGDVAGMYRRAYALDPTDPTVGIMAALDKWRSGQKDEAEAMWTDILSRLPPDDRLRTMYQVLRQNFASDAAQPAAPAPAAPPPAQAPSPAPTARIPLRN
jgi:cytochrome c-type biogenesis protein CcmH/NrfG